tara:strand:+ start:84 stop:365 length:282 start_codon:yes stop_codon:yes gene_type:complete
MKKLLILLLFTSTAFAAINISLAQNDESLLSESECAETKVGIRVFLGLADHHWKEIEKAIENGNEADEKLYSIAGFYAQQAANYSIVYDNWCD